MEDFEDSVELNASSLESTDDLEDLSESFKSYLQELNATSDEWQNLSNSDKGIIISDFKERLDEMGFENPEQQDRALRAAEILPEIIGEFREELFSDKISEIEQCSPSNEITKEQFMQECSEGAEIVSMMDERLANDCEDGIMNNIKYYKLDNGDFVLIHDAENAPNTKAVFSEGCVYAESGALKNGNQGLNEVLNTPRAASNTTYFVDGRTAYEHDLEGRLIKESTVYTQEFEYKSDRGSNQAYIRDSKDGVPGDESSHSVPYCLGGPNEAINQTPMRADINRGSGSEWNKTEREINNAVNEGKTVYVEHTYSYSTDTARPTDITLSTRLGDSESISIEFDNHLEDNNEKTEHFSSTLELSEASYVSPERCNLTCAEHDYIQEAINEGSEYLIVQRIDELNGDIVPPKAIDSNKEINELLGEAKEGIDHIFLEAPSDNIQIEQAAETISRIEGVQYENWEKLTIDEKGEVLQSIEVEVSEIAHRPPCKVNVQQLQEGCYGYYNPNNKEIVVNELYLLTNSPETYRECLDTILHEGRHAYQDFNMTCRQVHTSSGDISNWYKNEYEYGYQDAETFGFKAYAMQPVECDARKFAEEILEKIERV